MADEFTYLIAVGSNLGDRYEHIRQALDSLTRRSVFIQKQAALIETKPMGAADQPFVNGAFVAKSAHDPAAMMTLLLDVETELGRTRHIKWGNRTIDLDILLVRDSLGRAIEMTSDHLTVPHPRMWERDFVMIPAREVWNFKDSERLLGQYFSTEKSVFSWLILGAVTRWFLAWMVPFGNDEAYYWDWSRDLQISYFDHPPMVAWIGWLGTHLAPWADPTLSGRLIVPVMHFVACLGILKILKLLTMQPSLSPRENFNFVLITQLVPAFSLGGMMLMPDVGLILFSTLAIHATMKASRGKDLGIRQGFFVGLFWGLAGLSKYHAALLAVGGLGALAWQRRNDWLKDLWFWMTVVAVGLLVVSPVFVWNAQHQWASFAYQGSRGLSGDGFRVLPAFRTLVGELLFFGPLLLGGIWFFQKSAKSTSDSNRETNRAAVWFILFAALPLLFILKIFSFTSQTLPHWSVPSLWLLSPLAIIGLARAEFAGAGRIMRLGILYGILFCGILPVILAFRQGRELISRALGNKPGGLGELMIWDAASRNNEFLEYVNDERWTAKLGFASCLTIPYAAPRWFTVAQVAANLPGHPVVQTLDPDKLSYYNYRTPPDSWLGCPSVVISEEAHWPGVLATQSLVVIDQQRFVFPSVLDRPIIVARVVGKASDRSR